MAQSTTGIGNKNTGNSFSAAEFNTVKNTIDGNATDAQSRLVGLEGAIKSFTYGAVAPSAKTFTSTNKFNRIVDAPCPRDGRLTQIQVYVETVGEFAIKIYERDGATLNLTPVYSQSVNLTTGLNTINMDRSILKGQLVGYYSNGAAIHWDQTVGETKAVFWKSGNEVVAESLFTRTQNTELQIGYTVEYVPEYDSKMLSPYYIVRSSTDLSVFLPSGATTCIEYIYHRNTDLTIKHYDVWEFGGFYLCDSNRVRTFGESLVSAPLHRVEFAFFEDGASDYIGGSAHGWELMQSVVFLKDGSVWSPSVGEGYMQSLQVIQRSHLLRWKATSGESEDVIGHHMTKTTFSAEGVRLRTFIEWKATVYWLTGYICMLSVMRDRGATKITRYGIKDNTFSVEDISSAAHGEIHTLGTREMIAWGGDLGVTFSVKQIAMPDDKGASFFSEASANNKFYTQALNNKTVNDGDTLEAEHLIRISS